MTLLTAHSLEKHYGARPVLVDASFSLSEGEHVAILGVNGAGKSTLLRILCGEEEPDGGRISVRRGLSLGYLAQDPLFPPDATIREAMYDALTAHREALDEYHSVTRALGEDPLEGASPRLLAKLSELQQKIESAGGFDLEHRIAATLNPLGISDLDRQVRVLSGGERKRVAIGRVLLQRPDLLLLDEPTNHLDADTVLWLEEELRAYPGSIVLVTHDRYFLDKVVHRLIELDRGALKSYPGRYADYLKAKADELEQAERAERNRQNLLRTELEWLRRGPKARTTKSKARIASAHALLEAEGPPKSAKARIHFGRIGRLGKTILEAKHITKSYGGKTLIRDLSLSLNPGDKIGIIGPNGIGKSTLLRLIVGQETPDQGEMVHGKNTVILYFDQTRDELDPDLSVREAVADQGDYVNVNGKKKHIVSYLEDYLFPPEAHRMPIRSLSGGERNRVLLARLMKRPCNLLILDEPTNDLDILTLQVLEAAIQNFAGCVLTVTHDRFFLNKIATSILSFEGEGRVVRYEGNYDIYRALKGDRARLEEIREETVVPGASEGAGPSPKKGARRSQSTSDSASLEIGNRGRVRNRRPKLSWAQKRRLESLPAEIEAREAELAELQNSLSREDVFSDGRRLQEISQRMADLEQQIAESYAAWESLERIAEGQSSS